MGDLSKPFFRENGVLILSGEVIPLGHSVRIYPIYTRGKQLRISDKFGELTPGMRTHDHAIVLVLLYQLSYQARC